MPAPVLLDVLIEAALIALVSNGTFNAIAYDQDGNPSASDVVLPPREIVSYPMSSRFELDAGYGIALRARRAEWLWNVAAVWDQRVSLVSFERDAIAKPTIIPADPANGIDQQTELRFGRSAYSVQPRGGAQLTPSLLGTFQPGKASVRASWVVQAVLTPDKF